MSQSIPPGFWQTFFNLGGIAGALSLIWQVASAIWHYRVRPRLQIRPIKSTDILPITMPASDGGDERRYVTLHVDNIGRFPAEGCVARAQFYSQGSDKEVYLHWADTVVTVEFGGVAPTVEIQTGSYGRLDVAFSSRNGNGTWLASHGALNRFDEYARLDPGECRVDIRITWAGGSGARCRLLLKSSSSWEELDARLVPRS